MVFQHNNHDTACPHDFLDLYCLVDGLQIAGIPSRGVPFQIALGWGVQKGFIEGDTHRSDHHNF